MNALWLPVICDLGSPNATNNKLEDSKLSDVELVEKLLARDPYLQPYEAVLSRRIKKIREMEALLTLGRMALQDFASGHEYFGLHFKDDQWIFREWAPNATAIYLIGDMYEHMSIGDDNLVVDLSLLF